MYLKRRYKDGKVSGVKVLRAHKIEHLSPNMVQTGLMEGWASMKDGKFTVHGEDGDVSFHVVRLPDTYWCCHCDEEIVDAGLRSSVDGLTIGQRHVKDKHGDAKSPDPSNPAGYRKDNHFTLVTDDDVENMSREEAAAMEKAVRDELHRRLTPKYESRKVKHG